MSYRYNEKCIFESLKWWSLNSGGLKDVGLTIYVRQPLNLPAFVSLFSTNALRGDKVSMLTHTYPHKPLRKIKAAECTHQADSPLNVWPDI